MNIKEAWDIGYSGRGIKIAILDDGLQTNHLHHMIFDTIGGTGGCCPYSEQMSTLFTVHKN
jgi:hypothetical protein